MSEKLPLRYDRAPFDNHHAYQDYRCAGLSDNDLILGMVKAYKRPACLADHKISSRFPGHLSTDECRYFGYSWGGSDHFNMRWFKEWCEINRPQVIKRLYALKVFW